MKGLFCFFMLCAMLAVVNVRASVTKEITPLQFKGTDTERIQKAIDAANRSTHCVIIPRTGSLNGDFWSIDEALRLPSGMTVILDNCIMQLSDKCRDNMFRSDNVGIGISDPQWNHNIAIIGQGKAILRGANNPRATGDGLRNLSLNPAPNYNKDRSSYGSDAGKEGKKQKSDWRGFMILMAYVDSFQLRDVTIEYAHTWAVTFEKVHHADISRIRIHCPQYRMLNGKRIHTFNNDGIDLREGCKYFRIDDITSVNGDDCIALSALDMGEKYHKNGDINSFQVTSCAHRGPEDDIEHIYISNIKSNYAGVALRTSDSASIHHVYINGVTVAKDPQVTTPYKGCPYTLLVGNRGYGQATKVPHIHDIYAQNLIGDGRMLIEVKSPIRDCVFMNGIYTGQLADGPIVWRDNTRELSRNVTEINLIKQASKYDDSIPKYGK